MIVKSSEFKNRYIINNIALALMSFSSRHIHGILGLTMLLGYVELLMISKMVTDENKYSSWHEQNRNRKEELLRYNRQLKLMYIIRFIMNNSITAIVGGPLQGNIFRQCLSIHPFLMAVRSPNHISIPLPPLTQND